tara:strand:- start:37 stop:924 length:888 start_codon:yes stop_codon:yes gene_type:complete
MRKWRIEINKGQKIFLVVLLIFPLSAFGSSFSCPGGTDPACLDYGAKVCKSFSKCVSDNAKVCEPFSKCVSDYAKVCKSSAKCVSDGATCFEQYTCGLSNRFVCESDFDDLKSEYYDLLSDNQNLRNKNSATVSEYNLLVDKYNNLLGEVRAQKSNHSGQKTLTYRGYSCTKDCSGHKAGYNWALQKNLEQPRQCGGKSRSFIVCTRSSLVLEPVSRASVLLLTRGDINTAQLAAERRSTERPLLAQRRYTCCDIGLFNPPKKSMKLRDLVIFMAQIARKSTFSKYKKSNRYIGF